MKRLGGLLPVLWTPEMDRKLVLLSEAKRELQEIADEFGLSKQTIYRRRKALGFGVYRTAYEPPEKRPRLGRRPRAKPGDVPKPPAQPAPRTMKMVVDLGDLRIEKEIWHIHDRRAGVYGANKVAISLAKVSCGSGAP